MARDPTCTLGVSQVVLDQSMTEAEKPTIPQPEDFEIPSIEDHRSYNMGLPISSLPPELICNILRILANDTRRSSRRSAPSYSWIPKTHIFHYWRMAALADPRLWSTLTDYIKHTDFVEELLKRAKGYPLTFFISEHSSHSSPTFSALLNAGTKVGDLSIDLCGNTPQPVSEYLGSQDITFPELKVLSIHYRHSFKWSKQKDPTISLLGERVPSLVSLQLHGRGLRCNSLSLPRGISKLTLEEDAAPRGHINELFQCLSNLPNLRCLTLRHIIELKSLDSPSSSSRTTIALPLLSELTLTDRPRVLMRILQTITFPDDTCLDIHVAGHVGLKISRNEKDLRMLATMLGKLLASRGPVIRKLIYHTIRHKSTLVLSPGHRYLHSISIRHDLCSHVLRFFSHIMELLHTTEVFGLRWVTDQSKDSGHVLSDHLSPDLSFLRIFRHLIELWISGTHGVVAFRRWLSRSQEPLSLPQLHTLGLHDIHLIERAPPGLSSHGLAVFRRCIASRKVLLPRVREVKLKDIGDSNIHDCKALVHAICDTQFISNPDVTLCEHGSTYHTYTLPNMSEFEDPLESIRPLLDATLLEDNNV